MSNGKGSGRRPTQADAETVAANWDRTFKPKRDILDATPDECKDVDVIIFDVEPRPHRHHMLCQDWDGPLDGCQCTAPGGLWTKSYEIVGLAYTVKKRDI